MPLLSVENLTLLEQKRRRNWFRYDLSERVLLDDITFHLEKGKSLALVGEEKSGKHALVMALLKLYEVSAGKITFAEVETTAIGDRHFRRLRKRLQAVFSDDFGQLTPELTVDQMFREVLQLWYRKEDREQWYQRVEKVMIACRLPEAVRALYPAELDAVERQEVALARALLCAPDLLICHGFTKGLDVVQEAELLNLVRHVREEFGLTLLVVTDDLAVAHQLSEDIGVLHSGRLIEFGTAEEVVNRPGHDYTKRLVSCSI
ncbi:MAG: ATP-binding cassette domain-containing protein [Verrucomicrobiales bacterium]|nr:ATP-binding cassette domain-containing protein [Verrucomicrobiales bacterium]